MRRLLWKEYRERRLWAIPLGAAVVGVVALGRGYTYCGEIETFTAWIIPSALVGLLFGMSAYSGELAWGTPDFLHSRPISWRRVLAAKLIFGLGLIALVAVSGAIAFRLGAPEPYRRFATVAGLAPGIGVAILLMGVPYLIGFYCSVVLPGMIGAILMFAALGIAFAGAVAALDRLAPQGYVAGFLSAIAWMIAPIFAALFVLRFGLTLSIARRVRRYVAAMAVVIVAFTAADAVTHWVPWTTGLRQYTRLSISPDGRYVLAMRGGVRDTGSGVLEEPGSVRIVRLADKREATVVRWDERHPRDAALWVGWSESGEIHWTPNGTAYVVDRFGERDRNDVLTLKMTAPGRVRKGSISTGSLPPPVKRGGMFPEPGASMRESVPSPDGRILAMQFSQDRYNDWVVFVDVEKGIRLPKIFHLPQKPQGRGFTTAGWWWQSDTEIGYGFWNERERHIVRVVE